MTLVVQIRICAENATRRLLCTIQLMSRVMFSAVPETQIMTCPLQMFFSK